MAYKTRSGRGQWRWVRERKCTQCGRVYKILGNNSRGRPQLGRGGIRCDCGAIVILA
jgi:hypothetical protein